MKRLLIILLSAFCFFAVAEGSAERDKSGRMVVKFPQQPKPGFNSSFTLKNEDRIAFVGASAFAGENKFGNLETQLRLNYPQKKLHFRNIALEGDTVYRRYRDVNFGSVSEHLMFIDADVVFMQFGQPEVFEKGKTLKDFILHYEALVDQVQKVTRKVVLISPLYFEETELREKPDLLKMNRIVNDYAKAIAQLARKKDCLYVDILSAQSTLTSKDRLTRNGIHLNQKGHKWLTSVILKQLGLKTKKFPGLPRLTAAIQTKNSFWLRHYMPMNWAFAYGDRVSTAFSDNKKFKTVSETHRQLVIEADKQINVMLQKGAGKELTVNIPEKFTHSQGKKLTPDQEKASFKLGRDDLEVNVFASEKDGLINPMRMTWDERGRLWAICLPSYPQPDPGQKPSDYILICEDTNNDGRADKFTRFAEGLNLPMGLALADGGLYVANGTELIFLKDTDGDDKADIKKIILSGFGMGDTHQCINSLELAMDGSLWFSQGLHIFSFVETAYGVKALFRSGLWRYNRHNGKLDPVYSYAKGGLNCFGIHEDRWGNMFHVSGASPKVYDTELGLIQCESEGPKIGAFAGKRPASKKCGAVIIEGSHFPDDMQGKVLFAEYLASRVATYDVSLADGTWSGKRDARTFIESSSSVFRPVDIQHGSDGALYIVDWYNELIGHYQASYKHPKRDKTHGRIWRVTVKGRPLVKKLNLKNMSVENLLNTLGSKETWQRLQARRLLMALPKQELLPALNKWTQQLSPDKPGDNLRIAQALGLYNSCDEINEDLVALLLKSKNINSRYAAMRAVANWANRLKNTTSYLETGISDNDKRLQVLTIIAASRWRSVKSFPIVMKVSDRSASWAHKYVIERCANSLASIWAPAFKEGKIDFDKNIQHQIEAAKLLGDRSLLLALLKGFSQKLPEMSEEEKLLIRNSLATYGTQDDVVLMLSQAARDSEKAAILKAANDQGLALTKVKDGLLLQWIKSSSKSLQLEAIRAAAGLKKGGFADMISPLIKSGADEEVRSQALLALGQIGRKQDLETIKKYTNSPNAALSLASVEAWAFQDPVGAMNKAVDMACKIKEQRHLKELMEIVQRQKKNQMLFVRAISKSKISPEQAGLLRNVLLFNGIIVHRLRAILQKRMKVGKSNELSLVELTQKTQSSGNALKGHLAYAKAGCMACHAISGKGGSMGPDLSVIGRSYPADQVIQSVIEPNAVVKEGYGQITVIEKNGKNHSGYLANEDSRSVTLKNPVTGQKTVISKSKIKSQVKSGSPMPAGLIDVLSEQEKLDLLAYLISLGKEKKKAP